jgi:succinate-semialdehyde dehydrogenase/glutarate-semialdehyde dehydrogenase
MELGGHAPAIVFKDADVSSAAKILAAAKYRNAGQVCISPTRMLVQDDVFREFVDKFVEGAKAMKVGNGMDPDSKMGSLANPRRVTAIEGMVQDAVGKGAKLETGGHRVGNKGYFYEPTVVSDVPKDARAMNEEPFGPAGADLALLDLRRGGRGSQPLAVRLGVLRLHQFDQDRDRDRRRDRSRHGLDQQLWSCLAEVPFGGVKDSGYGSEGGTEAMDGLFQHQVHHPDRGVSGTAKPLASRT